MKPSLWLTIYMYKQHIKNQPKSNIWNIVKFEEQILHYFYAGQNVNIHTSVSYTHLTLPTILRV